MNSSFSSSSSRALAGGGGGTLPEIQKSISGILRGPVTAAVEDVTKRLSDTQVIEKVASVANTVAETQVVEKITDVVQQLRNQRAVEKLTDVTQRASNVLKYVEEYIPRYMAGMRIAVHVSAALGFTALMALLSSAVTTGVEATAAASDNDEHAAAADHMKTARLLTSILYSVSIAAILVVVIHSAIVWKKLPPVGKARLRV